MLTSFSTALSALNANTTAIDVVGNNLANLNTPGFKSSVVSFHDLVTQSIGSGAGTTQIGFGVGTPVTLRHFSQGAIQSTAGSLDAAIQGNGFFIVKTAAGAVEYTRAGSFQANSLGNLATPTGEELQGWSKINGVLNTNAPVGPITVPVGALAAPVPTTSASIDLNLNASAITGDAFSTSVEVFDSLGTSHLARFTFTKTATANQWNYSATLPAGDATPAPTPVTGTLTFDANGRLIVPLPADAPPVIAAAGLNDGAAALSVTWNIFNQGTPRLTQFAQVSATSAVAQNGSATANLVNVELADGGQILARYSNGQQIVVGQLAMATILNPESMVAVGDNNFQLSARTALPAVGLPGSGGRGAVLGGCIEASTADIAREFTNLIVFQRAYQASSKIITTVDQISQDTINLKQ
jgi:flagellar hook protein FlgE